MRELKCFDNRSNLLLDDIGLDKDICAGAFQATQAGSFTVVTINPVALGAQVAFTRCAADEPIQQVDALKAELSATISIFIFPR